MSKEIITRALVGAKNLATSGQSVGRAAVIAKDWVVINPGTVAAVAVAPAAAVVALPFALSGVGFGAIGVTGGKSPRYIQYDCEVVR